MNQLEMNAEKKGEGDLKRHPTTGNHTDIPFISDDVVKNICIILKNRREHELPVFYRTLEPVISRPHAATRPEESVLFIVTSEALGA